MTKIFILTGATEFCADSKYLCNEGISRKIRRAGATKYSSRSRTFVIECF